MSKASMAISSFLVTTDKATFLQITNFISIRLANAKIDVQPSKYIQTANCQLPLFTLP
jgi:hypothetical protein